MANHSSLGAFGKAFKKQNAKLEDEVARALRLAALSVVTDVAQATPILTGQAQSNWLTALDAPFPFFNWNEDSNGAWHEAVDFAHNVLVNVKYNTVIHITNNLPYIVKLNRGTSSQAPKLFVQLAVVKASYSLQSFRINWN